MVKELKKRTWVLLFIIFALISCWTTYKSIFYGCDIDESYAITLSYRLIMGDHLFKEMWEIHQLSAVFMAPFIWIYRAVFGNAIGMVAFLRGVCCFIHLCAAVIFYYAAKTQVCKEAALMLAAILYNYSPKYLEILEFCFLGYLFMMLTLSFYWLFSGYKKKVFLFFMGISLAGLFLSYPQIVFGLPIILFCLWRLFSDESGQGRNFIIVFGTLCLCGVIFLGYVLCNVSVKEALENIPMILADGAHQSSIFQRCKMFIFETVSYLVRFLIFALLFEIVSFFVHKFNASVFLFLSGIPLSVMYLSFDVRYKFIMLAFFVLNGCLALLYLKIRGKAGTCKDKKQNALIILFFAFFFLADIGSNLAMNENAGLMMPLFFVLLVYFFQKEKTKLSIIFLICLCFVFLLERGLFVRYTAVQPVTCFIQHHRVAVGALKNINLKAEDHIQYHANLALLQDNVNADDKLLYMGSDDSYLSFFIGTEICVPNTISTPVFDGTFLTYYERYPDKIPDVVIVNKFSPPINEIYQHEGVKDFIYNNYDTGNAVENTYLLLYRRKKEL